MKVEQIYTGCLAQGAYYIQSGNEAAIIDPLREIQPYLDRAEKDGVKITHIFETHFHADFVSGHIDLARETGARIVFGPTDAPIGFDAYIGKDGERFKIGNLEMELIHTPGHTMESACYLLYDEYGKGQALFTGDTLFIGDVGRPDLAQKVKAELTQDKLAEHLYHSLRDKIMPLPDDLIIYPAHGAGSACGKNMSKETTDTLGNQKKSNYALQPNLDLKKFKKEVLSGLTPPPAYFPKNVMMNILGYDAIDKVIARGTQALSPDAFEAAANETHALILDTRDPDTFTKGFIPNAINIGIDGNFAPWVGTMIPDIRQEILLVCEPGREEEVVTRLARVGYDFAIGYLQGGMEAWKKAGKQIDQIESITAHELADLMKTEDIHLLDVRRNSEYLSEHVEDVGNLPLDYINQTMEQIDPDKRYYIHCAGGYRSVIFCSILKSRGFENIVNVQGGFTAIKQSGLFPVTDYVCPTTLL